MIIEVSAKPGSRRTEVSHEGANRYTVRVTQPPVEGKANKAVASALSEYFKVSKSRVLLLKGEKGKAKVFSVDI